MNIYVGNISRTVTEDALRTKFEQYGTVTNVRIMRDRITQEPRGFAFVDMPVAEEAENAIANLNNQELDGNRLRVNEARPQEDRAPRSNGGGMGGGYRPGGASRPRTGGGMGGGNGGGWRR